MAAQPVCLVCQVPMERGFITDLGAAGVMVPRWCEGEPQASWISGTIKNAQYKDGIDVIAFRCPKCEALRLYAPSHPAQGH